MGGKSTTYGSMEMAQRIWKRNSGLGIGGAQRLVSGVWLYPHNTVVEFINLPRISDNEVYDDGYLLSPDFMNCCRRFPP